jgi:hypothetical protein
MREIKKKRKRREEGTKIEEENTERHKKDRG